MKNSNYNIIKTIGIFAFILLIFSCQKKENDNEHEVGEKTSQSITEGDIEKLDFIDFGLDIKTEQAIESWEAYYQIQDLTTSLRKGDINFFIENTDAIKTLLTDLKTTIPEKVNTQATQARLLVLETKMSKLESLANLNTTTKDELALAIKDFLQSFSNLNFQMNKKLEKEGQNIVRP